MIILYVPFERANCGDLGEKAKLWKDNYSLNTTEKISIIYYKDDFDYENIDPNSTIFILAHGALDISNILANHPEPNQASIINIDSLVSRFEFDFLSIIYKISAIHLYCCGNKQKNQLMANQFQLSLLRSEYVHIYFYQGIIYAPDKQGRFLTKLNNKIISSSPFTLLHMENKKFNSPIGHLPIKLLTMMTHQEFLKKERQKSSDNRREIRFTETWHRRTQKHEPEVIIPDNQAINTQNSAKPANTRLSFFPSKQPSTEEAPSKNSTCLLL
ncbi:RNA binding protein (contains ribosomal protein S1 domain) [Legionella busanensis]|uniref:RNA binding protein (Contains ribosomal protein S1 domain) n=1 Tax=Legionella busanensis TaxID=190655 RepID=A0A378JFX8_9GAMM|nr:hypothetical protein [Legionella busanensis]STX50014.1 RNA binding protein (contains ribosomal protein S1 domain) [Legionella busanensis]